MTRIALIADYDPASPVHAATHAALRHASDRLKADVTSAWVNTDDLSPGLFEHVSAVLIGPGSPYKDMEKVIAAIRLARERGVPCLGTCGGFQHMVIEYARHVLNVPEAQTAECQPDAAHLFITPLSCSLRGRSMALTFLPDSQVAGCYGATSATEQYYCNFGVEPSRVAELKSGALRVTGSDAEGEVRVIELPGHPFFIGTLFVPQSRSLPGRPHPLITAFVRAAVGRV